MPPSGEPVKELILQNLETTLDAIAAGADYYTEVRSVDRARSLVQAVDDTPAVLILPDGTTYDTEPARLVGVVSGTFRVGLLLVARDATTPQLTIERFIRDVHKALLVDITRGGNALNTRLVTDDVYIPVEETDPIVLGDLLVEIDYRTLRTNLNTAQL